MARGNTGNRILDAIDDSELSLLRSDLQTVRIEREAVLSEAGQAAPYVYFPVKCVLSLVGTTASGATVEVGIIGREGMASVSAALGRQRLPFRVVCQIEGDGWRIPTPLITRKLHECRDLHEQLLLYSHVVIAQVGQSAICNRFHNARQRLARWLLMTIDRADSHELPLTHEFISHMVGGPRSAVTEAAAELRESGAIDYRRGLLTIRNVQKLKQQACECYEVQSAECC